jgi:hypothetical protein
LFDVTAMLFAKARNADKEVYVPLTMDKFAPFAHLRKNNGLPALGHFSR